ncbi:hypothetical protein [Algoriphagus yeomjeoni]|uniref:Uncharacterized protein n=1 Tax=Algoriphagus yeomjeoni TaxID=291403 RepID=A0A327NZW1_9BACT|nr:hypothetical protein [Algoriphagus yeomjeoni]RAI85538.1 hypothetical protein LV83_03618 [Algoriphagus yeomjeoni]
MKALKSDPSKTVLVICTGLILVYFIFSLKWILFVAFGIGILSILSEWISKKIEWVWFQLTKLLSMIVPNILLGAIFYLFLTPIAFLANLFSKSDPLLIKRPAHTAYKEVNKQFKAEDLKNPW